MSCIEFSWKLALVDFVVVELSGATLEVRAQARE